MCGPQVRFCESQGRATSPGYSTGLAIDETGPPFAARFLDCASLRSE